MKPVLYAALLGIGICGAAVAADKPKPAEVTIGADTLTKATAANMQVKAAGVVLEATGKASKVGLVIETDGKTRIPPLVLTPTDPEWGQVVELAKKIAADRKAKAEASLKALGVTVTP
jgi:hypothetical protein